MDIIKKFNSVAEFEAYLNAGTRQKYFVEAFKESSKNGSKSFTGTESYEEADNLMKYGDRANYERIKKASRQIQVNGQGRRNELFTAICGVTPNVPAYLAGSPAAMINTRKKPVKTKVIKIYYNCAVDYTKDAEDMAKAAAAVLQTICDIENAGTRVQLYILSHTEKAGQNIVCCVCVKKAEERIDPLKIAYPTINPSFLRRHILKFIEVTPNVNKAYTKAYGHPVTDEKETKKIINDKGAVYLSCDSTLEWARKYNQDPAGFVYEEIHDQLNG